MVKLHKFLNKNVGMKKINNSDLYELRSTLLIQKANMPDMPAYFHNSLRLSL